LAKCGTEEEGKNEEYGFHLFVQREGKEFVCVKAISLVLSRCCFCLLELFVFEKQVKSTARLSVKLLLKRGRIHPKTCVSRNWQRCSLL
jgi:hypothetical protein